MKAEKKTVAVITGTIKDLEPFEFLNKYCLVWTDDLANGKRRMFIMDKPKEEE